MTMLITVLDSLPIITSVSNKVFIATLLQSNVMALSVIAAHLEESVLAHF